VNFYKHHLGDYDAATAHLSWDEDQAYTRLLRLYYRTEKPIPTDTGEACRLTRARTTPQRHAVEVVLREFFELRDTGWHNKRADEELAAFSRQVEHNRHVGSMGGRPRKPAANPSGFQDETKVVSGKNPNQNQIPEPITPLPPSGGFARFWSAWPKSDRKAARGKCEQLWRRGGFDAAAEQIVAHVEAMKSSIDWRKESGAYIPAPLVYLNQRRWEGADNRPAAPELRLAI
jgi:uncharacterized protein YdaU (DUF1376 family)